MGERSPQRIQLSRKAGWRKPEGAIVVARPSRWGNPYRLHDYLPNSDGRRQCVADFRWALRYHSGRCRDYPTHEEIRVELAGHDLACWCPLVDEIGNRVPCHADVLLEIANAS